MDTWTEGKNYRKREIRLANIFISTTVLTFVACCFIFYEFWINFNFVAQNITSGLYLMEAVISGIFFFRLMLVMKKCHNYEYNRVKKQIFIYFIFVLFNMATF